MSVSLESVSLESHRDKFEPHEWKRLLKVSALYAQWFEARVFSGQERVAKKTGEEILHITLSRIVEGCDGYTFRDGDVLFFHYLCRCCRRTVLTLQPSDAADVQLPMEEEDDTPAVLTERAATAFLQRRQRLDDFLAFLKTRKLKGKLRAYGAGFARYAAENWDVERIARDLRITSATVAKYRSRLRELVEEFEIERARRKPA